MTGLPHFHYFYPTLIPALHTMTGLHHRPFSANTQLPIDADGPWVEEEVVGHEWKRRKSLHRNNQFYALCSSIGPIIYIVVYLSYRQIANSLIGLT